MDRDSNVVQIITTAGGGENWSSSVSGDNSVWATEDDYRFFNNNNDAAESTPKRSRNSQDGTTSSTNNRSKAIGKMFFKTKLCCKFRAGTCPYVTNCNFAHSIEELRRPPPNWQEIVAAHEEEKSVPAPQPPREEFQIPSLYSGEAQRSYKGRHCKKFFTEEGCPYGDSCTFLHDESSRNRESVAISLGPGGYGGGGGGGGGGSGGGSGVVVVVGGGAGGGGGSNLKPSNWKTRICNKWELTGYCPFGSKCHFAHGAAELNQHGGLMEGENRDTASTGTPDTKHGVPSKTAADNVVASVTPVAHSDVYHIGVPSQRSSIVIQKPGPRTQKWKGPDKISLIYGDWIDDIE